MQNINYTGRFAPSPSGNLHFGSLIAALGSYLQAKAQQGKWLVRIDDLDPPREVTGAATAILHTLEHYGLEWDGEVLYQSRRHAAYQSALEQLQQQNLCYFCNCSRQRLQTLSGIYDGHCRTQKLQANTAIRLRQKYPVYQFTDQLWGEIDIPASLAEEDFILRRRDGLYAYNLAVVVDDLFQGVTEVVRGADLLEPTARQISLYHHLGQNPPRYLHLPLVYQADGSKLSKQNHAEPLPHTDPRPSLIAALRFLAQPLPDDVQDGSLPELLTWAIKHWSTARIPTQK